jgi:hypothetical protein
MAKNNFSFRQGVTFTYDVEVRDQYERLMDLTEATARFAIFINGEWQAVECDIEGSVVSIQFETDTLLGNYKYEMGLKLADDTIKDLSYGFLIVGSSALNDLFDMTLVETIDGTIPDPIL